jgi:1-acyl-sn-glycerol-3-phosphate acyltransferase
MFASFLFNILFIAWTGLCTLGTAPFSLLFPLKWLGFSWPRKSVMWIAYVWGVGVQFILKHTVSITYEIKGIENLSGRPVIFACKHQSAWETTMIQIIQRDTAVILKHELLWIPIFGQALWMADAIAIRRSQGKKTLPQLVEQAQNQFSKGRSIFIFPEGTRMSPDKPTKCRHGIFALYQALGCNVVPIGLNAGRFWGRRSFIKKSGHIIMNAMAPIEPGLDEKSFFNRLNGDLDKGSQKPF